jgi:transmembrane protein 216
MYTGKPSSSLPLQIVLYIEQVYSWVYFLLEGLLYVFRGQFLAYPTHALNLELAGLFFFGVVQLTRVFLGSFQIGTIGNKTERSDILVWGLILLFPSLLGGIFFIRLQVYV